RSRIVDTNGSLLAEVQTAEDRTSTTINRVPDVMVHALLAIEDSRFYQHRGVDFRGVIRAAIQNRRAGSVQQGASTLTQQYVKNALLTIAQTPEEKRQAVEVTPSRKIREARLALEMERRFTKDEILERYLNIAYFGNGSYGVRTAAQFYFSVPVEKLTLPQAALLAGLVQSPSGWDPVRHPEAALRRRNVVLSKMAELFPCPGAAGSAAPIVVPPDAQSSAGQPTCYTDSAAEAMKLPIVLKKRESPGAAKSVAPYFLDYVQNYLLEQSTALGKTKEEREAAYFRGGLTIRTTLDSKIQAAAQAALASTDIPNKEPSTAIVVIEPGTGYIRAMAVNSTPTGERSLNLATGGQFGMQAGSTFKTFVLAAALQQGLPLGTSFPSPQQYTSPVFKDNGKPYTVNNASDSESGTFNLITGTALSVNTFFMQLEEKTTIPAAVQIARKMMGPHPARPIGKADEHNPSFVLGTSATSVLDVANAYATIAARGMACQALSVEEVHNSVVRYPVQKPTCVRALDEKVADTMTFVLRGVIDGDHPRTGFRASIGRPAAGKTGTATDYRSAFFAGFTPDYAAAVWMGNSVAPGSEEGKLLNVPAVDGPPVEKVYGGTFPAVIWQKTMSAIEAGKPVRQFVDPPPDIFIGTEIDVPSLGGMTLEQAQTTLAGVNLSGVVATAPVNSTYPAGTVAYSVPGKGAKATIGSSVTIYLSNGIPPAPVVPPACAPGVSPPVVSPPPAGSSPAVPVVPCTIAPTSAPPVSSPPPPASSSAPPPASSSAPPPPPSSAPPPPGKSKPPGKP
ncbi:MAG: hypothetical protein QOG49_1634, partial [Frankiaceae bacterium]|nr:hypothetical protein [Frankiaceae bacterium]